ncbi:MAG: hypothetical protein D6766_07650 [Verrucomicrobia bacterium]|nr:MAG: hypothetical protein D6766_07650 [Verrucomicrobiota bacterium]
MKLLFSESGPDYSRYLYPYVVWAVPEPGETPADLYERGFLPASPNLDRFCLCRHVRVDLTRFRPSSENRRVLRKGEGVDCALIPRGDFDYTAERRQRWHAFARERFGEGVMPFERLDGLMHGKVITHLLHFTHREDGRDLGTALLYVEPPRMAHYYFAFYDLAWFRQSLGLHMMTRAVVSFAEAGFRHLYLGTCYSRRALYKTQFEGLEFFNGNCWSPSLEELKHLIARQERPEDGRTHLLVENDYLQAFWEGRLDRLTDASPFRLHGGPGGSARA